ncbi:MAG: ABC transporter substrate-binding protein [Spirochaetaceae bacterium]|nr:ABC transporter substrate-binding protein [Spirochaetaceae bacterium]
MRPAKMLLLLAVAVGLAAGCARPAPAKTGEPVVVATMIDTEGSILGKMIVQLLEAEGIPVVDKTEFGTPDVLRKALEAKEVHLVVDYTGSGQYYHEGQDPAVWSDAAKGYEATKRLDEAKGIAWLTPAAANNTESLAVKREFAEKTGIRDLPAFAAYVNKGGAAKLIAAQSYADNPLGLIGLEKAYGFTLRKDQLILLSSGNTAEMLKALSEGTNGVNVSLVYGTDGALDEMKLLVLADPKGIPPVYLPAPVILAEKLAAYPRIEALLKPVFESLDLETLQRLNASVAFKGRDAREVGKEYLVSKGFLKK